MRKENERDVFIRQTVLLMKSGKKDKFFGAIPLIISIAMLLFCAFLVFEAFRYGGEK